MFVKSFFFPGAVAAALLCSGSAQAGNESRYQAYPLDNKSFEVIAEFTENAIYWCGASIFARSQMGRPVSQRIYVLQSPGPSRTRPGQVAVRFGLTPPSGAENDSYTNSVGLVGNSLTVSQGAGGCTSGRRAPRSGRRQRPVYQPSRSVPLGNVPNDPRQAGPRRLAQKASATALGA